MAIACHLQGDNVHAVELHMVRPRKTHLLFRGDLEDLDLGVARALMVEMNELWSPSMESIDCAHSSIHHDLHDVTVSRVAGGVMRDPLDRRLKVREELLGRLPVDAAHLGLCILRGTPHLWRMTSILFFVPWT